MPTLVAMLDYDQENCFPCGVNLYSTSLFELAGNWHSVIFTALEISASLLSDIWTNNEKAHVWF